MTERMGDSDRSSVKRMSDEDVIEAKMQWDCGNPKYINDIFRALERAREAEKHEIKIRKAITREAERLEKENAELEKVIKFVKKAGWEMAGDFAKLKKENAELRSQHEK